MNAGKPQRKSARKSAGGAGLFRRAVAHHQAGRFAEAEALYREALAAAPDNPAVLHMLGLALVESGQVEDGAVMVARAIELAPNEAPFHLNLGNIRLGQNRPADAAQSLRRAVRINPGNAAAHTALGQALMLTGDASAAEPAFARALEIIPGDVQASTGLGAALTEQGLPADALPTLEGAVARAPDNSEALLCLGNAYLDLRRLEEAVDAFSRAAARAPENANIPYNLGLALKRLARHEEAREALESALALRPDWAQAHNNLGNVLSDLGRFDEATTRFERAAELDPEFVQATSNRLYAMFQDERLSANALFAEFRAWDARHARPVMPARARYDNDADPDRRLRVGYVSPDFRGHAVSFFLLPLLANHDPARVEITCYAESAGEDDTTRRFKDIARTWRPTAGLSDAEVAQTIRRDGIDILVDLAGHTAGNRLLAFARRPAPVQIASLLGLTHSTGLEAMDAILGDDWITPEGCEGLFSETVHRLARPLLAFAPDPGWPAISPLPAVASGRITFASFNKPTRIGTACIDLWARVLDAVPGSRLLLKHADYGAETVRGRVRDGFAGHGLADRLEMRSVANGWAAGMGVYEEVDIALDTWPMSGGSTSCIALWMGLPLVSLAGDAPQTRFGRAILAAADAEWGAAGSADDFVERAAALADDSGRLAEIRAGLRDRLRAAPIRDEKGLARATEDAYRALWSEWCRRRARDGGSAGATLR